MWTLIAAEYRYFFERFAWRVFAILGTLVAFMLILYNFNLILEDDLGFFYFLMFYGFYFSFIASSEHGKKWIARERDNFHLIAPVGVRTLFKAKFLLTWIYYIPYALVWIPIVFVLRDIDSLLNIPRIVSFNFFMMSIATLTTTLRPYQERRYNLVYIFVSILNVISGFFSLFIIFNRWFTFIDSFNGALLITFSVLWYLMCLLVFMAVFFKRNEFFIHNAKR